MPQRKYPTGMLRNSTEREMVTNPTKRITLPIELAEYQSLSQDGAAFRVWLDEMIEQYPELFPPEIETGYTLHDRRPPSLKLAGVQLRRVGLKKKDGRGQTIVLTIAPSGVMPYMTGYTDEVEKALFLRRFGG